MFWRENFHLCPDKTPLRAGGCYIDVCVKRCHWRALKHMDGVRESRAERGEAEEEERKSLVSSTHLSSSEYSARIGKTIQSSRCSLARSLPAWPYKAGASALLPWQRTVTSQSVATVSATVADTWMQTFTHTHTHTWYTCKPTPAAAHSQTKTQQREKENGRKSRTSHTFTASTYRLCYWLPPTQTTTPELLCWPTLAYSPN